MYETSITTPEEAICHLFLHCCYKDGQFTPAEIDTASAHFVALDMQKQLNFKDEIIKYTTFREAINTDEMAYLQFLIKHINPTHILALYSWCMELCLGDAHLDAGEEFLLQKIATILEIDDAERNIINRLMIQRKAVELQKLF